MRGWWTSRTARERALMALAGGIAVALAAFQLVLVPLQERRDQARGAYAEALGMLAEVREGVAQAPPSTPAGDAVGGASLRSALTASATQRGLSIARIQPLDDGALSLRFERAEPVVLYEWLASMVETAGVRVRQATLQRDGESGAVQATLVLEEGRS